MSNPPLPSSPGPPPPAPSDVRPTTLQAALTFAGGIVLATGSCAGFLVTLNLNRESTVNTAFALGFIASVLVTIAGVVLIVVRLVRLARHKTPTVQPSGPGGTPPEFKGGGVAAPPARSAMPEAGPDSAWRALVLAAVLLVAAVGFVVLLVVTDPNPAAVVFLVLAAISGAGSMVALALAVVRYGRRH